MVFTFRPHEPESDLERALQGIPFSDQIQNTYSGYGREKEKLTKSPVYLLLVHVKDNVVHGSFPIDGQLAEAPIGFLRERGFPSTKAYYTMNRNLTITKEADPQKTCLYILVQQTKFLNIIGDLNEKGEFIPEEGSPFSILGIHGSNGVHPLLLVYESDGKITTAGLYKTKDDDLMRYNGANEQLWKISRKQIMEILKGSTSRSSSAQKVFQGTAQESSVVASPVQSDRVVNETISWEEPKSIVAYLDQYVIGQDDAKKVIAVAFSNYMTQARIQNNALHLHKDNVLLIGPSGVGKTYMVSLLAKKASLPMVQTKVTGKSTEGYKGENISTVFEHFRDMTTGDAPYGIIFFDEIDKLAREEGTGNFFGNRIQDELIGWLEDATVLGDRNEKMQDQQKKNLAYSTSNILFVTAGTFQGVQGYSLTDIVQKRLGKGRRQVGFGARQDVQEQNEGYVLEKVRPEDLIAYGLKPELMGRLPSLGVLHPLTIDDKVHILTTAQRSPIMKYVELLQLKGYHVEIEPEVQTIIAERCPKETGARALTAICNDLFTEILFDPQQYANAQRIIRVTPDLARRLINLYG